MTPDERHREAVLVDMECPYVDYLLHNASSSRAFHYRRAWLLHHNSLYNRSIIEEVLENYDILPDSDVVWSSLDRLVDVYRLKAKHPYLLTDLGLNRNASKQDLVALWRALPTTVARRKDLKYTRLVGGSVVTQPEHFRGWSDVSSRQIDTYPKFTHPLVLLLAQDLNFHLALRQVDLYGVLLPNGSFDGLMGLLQRHEVEVGLGASFMRQDRIDVLHFFSETLALTAAFIFRQPSRSEVSNVFLAPFSCGVWLSCGLVALSAALLLALLSRVRQTMHDQSHPKCTPLTLPDTCTFALGALCQQGFYITPAMSSIRVVMFSMLLAALFVFTAYCAKIVTLLQMPSHAVRTLDDLTHSRMQLAVQETTYKKVYFVESTDAPTQLLYRRKIAPQGERAYLGAVEGIARVRTGLFAFMVERNSGYDVITKTFTDREKCSLAEIEALKLPMVAIPMRKFSGYRELFAVRMRWQREVGLMGRERRVWLADKPRCEAGAGEFVSIGINDVLPALQVLALGALLSAALLGMELLTNVLKKKPKKLTRYIHHRRIAKNIQLTALFREDYIS